MEHLATYVIDLGLAERALLGPKAQPQGKALLSVRYLIALVEIEDADVLKKLPCRGPNGGYDVSGRQIAVYHEREVLFHRRVGRELAEHRCLLAEPEQGFKVELRGYRRHASQIVFLKH